VGGRKEICFLEFMYLDVAGDFVDVQLSMPFLMVPRAPITTHQNCCCFEPPHSLYLDFQIFVCGKLSMVLTEVLASKGTVMSMRRQVLSFSFFSTMSSLLAAMVLSVWWACPTEW